MPAKPQIEVCNRHFDGIWNQKNLEKHRFGPETSKSNPCMERVSHKIPPPDIHHHDRHGAFVTANNAKHTS